MVANPTGAARLAVLRDGIELPEEQARALWRAFSEHMERNREDVEGFARDHGFTSVRAEHRRGRAVLVVVTSQSIPPPARRGEARASVRPASRPSRTSTGAKGGRR